SLDNPVIRRGCCHGTGVRHVRHVTVARGIEPLVGCRVLGERLHLRPMIFISRFMAGAVTLPECLTPNKCVRICGFVCVMVVGGGAFVVVAMAIPGFVRVAPVILVIVEVVASALLLVRIVAGFVRVVAVVGVTTVAVVGAIPSVMRVVPIFVHVI